jgi:hypothetical protein
MLLRVSAPPKPFRSRLGALDALQVLHVRMHVPQICQFQTLESLYDASIQYRRKRPTISIKDFMEVVENFISWISWTAFLRLYRLNALSEKIADGFHTSLGALAE